MPYTYEVHLHTNESSLCGKTPAREYIPFYMDQGYQGIVVTDHFTGNTSYIPDRNATWPQQVREFCRGYEEALDEGIRRGFDVFFGIEQQIENDEFLVYGPDPQWLLERPDTPRWTRRQWFDAVSAMGGCIVLAHPFRVRDYIKRITLNTCVHAVEAFNGGNNPVDDVYGRAYALHYGYPMTAGTDMHYIPRSKELYGVVFDEPWENIFSYARAIREKQPFQVRIPEGRGEGIPLPLQLPYERLDEQEHVVEWDVSELFVP